MIFSSQKLVQTYYQCLESIIIAHFNYLFLLTLALKTMPCVVTLLVMTLSKFNPNVIKILYPIGYQ